MSFNICARTSTQIALLVTLEQIADGRFLISCNYSYEGNHNHEGKNVKQKNCQNIIVYLLPPFKAPHISSTVQQERFILKTEF